MISIENTNPWTTDTISSKTPKSLPIVHTKGILQIREISTCPAVILANKRKQRVIGRTLILISSTKHKKGIRYQGEFRGRREERDLNFIIWIKILVIQHERAADKLNPKVVVRG